MALQSFYGQMLVAMQTQITTQVPEIRYVDQDLGQLESYEVRPAVSFPCVLIDFNATRFNQLGQQVEEGDCTLQVRLGFAPYSASNSLAPEGVREKALNYYEIEKNLFAALKGWAAEDEQGNALCQPLNRISDGTEGRDDKLRVRVLVFTTSYFDDGAADYGTQATPELSLSYDD